MSDSGDRTKAEVRFIWSMNGKAKLPKVDQLVRKGCLTKNTGGEIKPI
jgi:hypothetical protein